MSVFAKNVSRYLAAKKIKQSYLALKSGMNANKISRILNGQNVTENDMEAIASALGEPLNFFLSESFSVLSEGVGTEHVFFYSGDIEHVNKETITDCLDLLETIHSVLGRRNAILQQINEDLYENRKI